MCVCVRERESVRVCLCACMKRMSAELEKRMLLLFHTLSVFVCVRVCTCVRDYVYACVDETNEV